jgi:hypothetical protein
VLAW